MPNMLAHFGAQAVLTRTVLPQADIKIIFLGCLLPDVPWILQRLVFSLSPNVDAFTLRLYFITQASLFMTLILCGALASLSTSPKKVFSILVLNSLLHLLLDALQTKWGNGVLLFAPLSWSQLNFEWFWPESLPTYVLTLLGLGYIGWAWRRVINESPLLPDFSSRKTILALGLFGLYFALPMGLLDGPRMENTSFNTTLQDKHKRTGQEIEFDRRPYVHTAQKNILRSTNNEEFQLHGKSLTQSGTVSIRGRFLDPSRIQVIDIHEHVWGLRDGSSYIAILLLVMMWGLAFLRTWKSPHEISSSK